LALVRAASDALHVRGAPGTGRIFATSLHRSMTHASA
jgi:hypothetical protein